MFWQEVGAMLKSGWCAHITSFLYMARVYLHIVSHCVCLRSSDHVRTCCLL